jgi:hypothetical protein
VSWTVRGDDERYCAVHDLTFSRVGVCTACLEAHDASLVEEREVSAVARRLALQAAAMQKRSEAWSDRAEVAIKADQHGHAQRMGTLALQYARFAEDLRQRGEDIERDDELLEHDERLAGLRGSH